MMILLHMSRPMVMTEMQTPMALCQLRIPVVPDDNLPFQEKVGWMTLLID